jgi:hypothetical protein
MTEVRFKKFEWDWKDQPDWDEINEFVHSLGTIPYFYQVDTHSDSYGVLVADKKLMDGEVKLLVEGS